MITIIGIVISVIIRQGNGAVCPNNCNYCEVDNVCITCNDGWYEDSGSCINCDSSCSKCSSVNYCLSCSTSGYTPSSSGACKCSSSEYITSSSPLSCGACDPSCNSCVGSGLDKCLGCADPLLTMNTSPGNCKCGETQYVKNQNPVTCSSCHASCHSCSWKGSNMCLTCADSSITIASPPGSCTCSASRYIITKSPLSCGNCDAACATCSGSSIYDCLTCTDSTKSPLFCGNCDSSCASCSGPGSSECYTCADSSITIANPPDSCSCLSDQYIIARSPLSCGNCHSSCKTCSGSSSSQCYTCTNSARTPVTSPGSCICLENQYVILDSPLTCGNCHQSCATCLGSARNQCLTCSNTELMLSIYPEACECLPGQYIMNKDPFGCGNCDPSCSACVGPNENQCLACKNSTVTLKDSPGKCFCGSSQYVITYSPLICENCNSACLECSGSAADDCISCKNSSIISSTKPGYCSCLDSEYVFSASPLQCDFCHESCKTCSGPFYNDCLTCKNSTISPSKIYNQCICMQSEYIISISPLTCGACSENCLSCSGPDENQCIQCKNEAISPSLDGYCDCKENEYIISLSPLMCGPCDKSCKACSGPYKNQCLACNDIALAEKNSSCSNANDSSGLSTLSTTIKNSGTATSIGLIFAGFAESIITGKSGSLWTYINIVQVLAFIPLQNIAIPENLFQFWKAFLSYTYLHNTGKYFFGENKIKELEPIESFYKYGYESSSFLVNGAGMLLISVVIILAWSLTWFLALVPNSKIQYQMKELLGKFKYNIFIRLWVEIYILLMTAAIIGINHYSFQTNRTITDTILAYITFLSGWIITFILTFLLYIIQFKVFKKSKKVKHKYGCLFEEFKFSQRYIELLYYPIFLIRRLIFVINLYDLAWIPVAQWIVNVLHSFFIVILLSRYCHFKTKEKQFLNVSGESLVAFSFLLTGLYLLNLPYIIDYAIQCAVLCATYIYLIASYYFLIIKAYNLIKARRSRDKVFPELTMNAIASENNDLITSGRLKEISVAPHNSLEGDMCQLDSDIQYS